MNNDLKSRLRARLHEQGFEKIPTRDADGFRAACEMLGRITQTIDVRLKPDETQYPYRPEEVPFHTDHPSVPVVAWHCYRQDDSDGSSLLIDTREVVERLPMATRRLLTAIRLRVLHRGDPLPLLVLEPYQIYWLPVVVEEELERGNRAHLEAINAFRTALASHVSEGKAISIRLQPGEALFVNNHVMLHGRRAINEYSKRHLMRAYVKSP